MAKREYANITGRKQKNDVLLYQLRQSFKPGEITPEDANRLSYELALTFTKGRHAFLVCTHEDKAHIHSHIYINSTTLDCTKKFRNFWGSSRAIQKISDRICLENFLSVVENPNSPDKGCKRYKSKENKPSWRDKLRTAIDMALEQKPDNFNAFLEHRKIILPTTIN